MSYVSASGSYLDQYRNITDTRENNDAGLYAYWESIKARLEAVRVAAAAKAAAAEAKAAAEKAQLGAATAASEAAAAKAKLEAKQAEKAYNDLGPAPGAISSGLFGLSPTTLVMLGVAGYFLFIKPRKRGGRR